MFVHVNVLINYTPYYPTHKNISLPKNMMISDVQFVMIQLKIDVRTNSICVEYVKTKNKIPQQSINKKPEHISTHTKFT